MSTVERYLRRGLNLFAICVMRSLGFIGRLLSILCSQITFLSSCFAPRRYWHGDSRPGWLRDRSWKLDYEQRISRLDPANARDIEIAYKAFVVGIDRLLEIIVQ